LRVTAQKLLEELKVQAKCPRKAPVKVVEDRADTGAAMDRENTATRTTGIRKRALDAILNINSAQSLQAFFV